MDIKRIIGLACALGVLGSFGNAECMKRGIEGNEENAPPANIERLSPEIKELIAKANDGDAEAQYKLGEYYYNIESFDDAVEWYQKAAEQGHIEAQFMLGLCYEYGDVVAKDTKKAFQWYQKAAEQGYSLAQYKLGRCYEYGDVVAKDTAKAFQWYQKAADQGHEFAKEKLEIMALIAKADKGDAEAQYKLGEYCYGIYRFGDAAEWYEKAAKQGHRQAQYARDRLTI